MDGTTLPRFTLCVVKALAALLLVVGVGNTPTAQAQGKRQSRTNPAKAASSYSCPMHPSEKSRRPGTCAKCGMDLRPARKHKNAPVAN